MVVYFFILGVLSSVKLVDLKRIKRKSVFECGCVYVCVEGGLGEEGVCVGYVGI